VWHHMWPTLQETNLDAHLTALLDELAAFGDMHDDDPAHHASRMLNITPDTGAFLGVLVKAVGARRILEIGTSNGYSTLWLANAVGSAGIVTTVELAPAKIALARANFARARLAGRIDQLEGDAGPLLAGLEDGAYDLLFLDSLRSAYLAWWPDLKRVLRPGGLLVVDNATSHPQDMADFTAAVHADSGFTTSLVPVGKGEFLAVKA
jgi:predicted O-methyltransferase YrrM